jgi:uncharacterized protein YbjT (DUF2867 family)
MKIAIAGASGFVGQMLIEDLKDEHEIIALGRSQKQIEVAAGNNQVEWRSCDLFSLLQTEQALIGAEIGIYLVHSMLTRAKLTQSTFEDCDLLLADNFARAAQKVGLKRIVYLSGLIPAGKELSRHLESRREVEVALSSHGNVVTTVRAGLIIGAKGSSFQMLYLLVKRLPVMICPSWTRTRTQCIAAPDIVRLIRFCINDPRTLGRTFDAGNAEVVTYRELMRMLAEVMGKHRRFFSVPFFSPGLSRLWVQLITGGSRNLVRPLVESLRHEMVVGDSSLIQMYGKPLESLRKSLADCIVGIKPTLRRSTRQRLKQLSGVPEVRSIQRLPLPHQHSAQWLAQAYFNWLPNFLWPLVLVEKGAEANWIFRFAFLKIPLLVLSYSHERSTEDRQLFYIRGGLLSHRQQNEHARLEFREVMGRSAGLAAIHEFKPSLPWFIYIVTQAWVHLWVMNNFRRHLRQGS